jgi:2-methylisocitrate lyase-like PEP mutase family enzyme
MTKPSQAQALREILSEDTCHVMPCCWDGLSAKMIGDAGFRFSFMSGFAVSASRIGAPDTGLISFGEMLDQGRNICAATDIPIIGDGDTGYGNALNVRRTVEMYARAGFGAVMIEDQVAPSAAAIPRASWSSSARKRSTGSRRRWMPRRLAPIS